MRSQLAEYNELQTDSQRRIFLSTDGLASMRILL